MFINFGRKVKEENLSQLSLTAKDEDVSRRKAMLICAALHSRAAQYLNL